MPLIEFKEIRKEWKARKKEEEQQRKQQEEQERARHVQQAHAAQNGGADPQGTEAGQPASSYASRQLPPIAYGPQYPPSSGAVPQQPIAQYSNGHMYADNYQGNPPYAGQSQQMYPPRE
jgi:transcription factor CON7